MENENFDASDYERPNKETVMPLHSLLEHFTREQLAAKTREAVRAKTCDLCTEPFFPGSRRHIRELATHHYTLSTLCTRCAADQEP